MDPKTTKAAHTITQAAAARTASPPQHPQDDAVRHRRPRHIPLSLGKASLRLRLEAYYSLIAPATVSDRTVWLPIYDQIYDKYGGTQQGERKLRMKLAKKYGTAVRLLLVPDDSHTDLDDHHPTANNSPSDTGTTTGNAATAVHQQQPRPQHEEEWYRLRPEEVGSHNSDFLSSNFNPVVALLQASEQAVSRSNPWLGTASSLVLDNVEKCTRLLPTDDPCHRAMTPHRRSSSTTKKRSRSPPQTMTPTKATTPVVVHPFEAIASAFETGPHSVLGKFKNARKRVVIVIRYVNMIRGTVTGTILAFDKHMNLILTDAEEVYSPRLPDDDKEHSNVELEQERRRRVRCEFSTGEDPNHTTDTNTNTNNSNAMAPTGTWTVRRRQMKQLLVRGDMVVAIYEAPTPRTRQKAQNSTQSRYIPKTKNEG